MDTCYMLEWGGIFPKWIRTTGLSLNMFPLPFSPRAVDRLWVLGSNALPHCQNINWINVSWCLFGEDVHCICLWYLNSLHNPFPFARPQQQFSRMLGDLLLSQTRCNRALSTWVNFKEKGTTTGDVSSSGFLSLSLFGKPNLWLLLPIVVTTFESVCKALCGGSIGRQEGKGTNWQKCFQKMPVFLIT